MPQGGGLCSYCCSTSDMTKQAPPQAKELAQAALAILHLLLHRGWRPQSKGHAQAYCLPPASLSAPAASSVRAVQESQTETPTPAAHLQQCNKMLEGSHDKLCDTAACIKITFLNSQVILDSMISCLKHQRVKRHQTVMLQYVRVVNRSLHQQLQQAGSAV